MCNKTGPNCVQGKIGARLQLILWNFLGTRVNPNLSCNSQNSQSSDKERRTELRASIKHTFYQIQGYSQRVPIGGADKILWGAVNF